MELIIGSALCLLHLGIGMAIGWRMAPGRSADGFALPTSRHAKVEYVCAQWSSIHVRLMELTSVALEIQPAPRELLSQWLSELNRLTSQLRNRVEGVSSQVRPPPLTIEQATGEIVTNEQILELVGTPVPDGNDVLMRYRFPLKQPLAPYVDAGPLPVEAFDPVQCHDLSIRDIRFFVDEPPTADKVVLGLGVPSPVKWMGAEIEDFRSAFMYGRVGYLVTARFLACIDKRVPMPSQI